MTMSGDFFSFLVFALLLYFSLYILLPFISVASLVPLECSCFAVCLSCIPCLDKWLDRLFVVPFSLHTVHMYRILRLCFPPFPSRAQLYSQ